MALDIFISYGAEHVAHILNLLVPSIAAQSYAEEINLSVVNYSASKKLIGDLQIDQRLNIRDLSADKQKRLGFGEAMNFMFNKQKPDNYFITLNPDTILDKHCLENLVSPFVKGKTGIVEARQWPSEHPKEYDAQTLHTPWASGACSLICSDFFASAGGFDPIYFMYCEDVDLSWQAWQSGLTVIYAENACLMHSTGIFAYRDDRFYLENFYSARNFLVLAKKFFSEQGEARARDLLDSTTYPNNFKRQVVRSFEKIKLSIKEKPTAHKMIKITAFNMYHNIGIQQ